MKAVHAVRCSRFALAGALLVAFGACDGSSSNKGAAPLPNKVAAGDVTDTSAVLWARTPAAGDVTFEYSTDVGFGTIDGSQIVAVSDPMAPAKAAITGLSPGTQYYYRAKDSLGRTSRGSFRTAQPAAASAAGLRFGVSGDWRGDLAPFPAISNAAGRDLDFFVALGDTIYADFPSPDLMQPQALTIDDYRIKHNEVYSLRMGRNTLADLRASTAFLATIDDHEVTNDFAGGASPPTDPVFAGCLTNWINECALYADGMQAFQEYNPLEDLYYGLTGDPRTQNKRKLYRSLRYGTDAAVFLLDARSFRDEELVPANPTDPVDIGRFLAESFDPARTMLGAEQLADLQADLLQAQTDGVAWKFVMVPEPIQNFGVVAAEDRFEGYAAERTAILQFIDNSGITGVVFIAADVHGTIVNNITYQTSPIGAQIPLDAFEITTGAVAFSPPFGPTVAGLALTIGLISQTEYDAYLLLSRDQQDAFIRTAMDGLLLLQGYDLIGLAGSGINAALLQGDYVSVHTYGWTEFEIDPSTMALTVTTYGIDWYSEADLAANPGGVLSRTPQIVSQFVVN